MGKIYNPQFRKLSLGERPNGERSDGEDDNKTPRSAPLLHAYSTDGSPDNLQLYNSRLTQGKKPTRTAAQGPRARIDENHPSSSSSRRSRAEADAKAHDSKDEKGGVKESRERSDGNYEDKDK